MEYRTLTGTGATVSRASLGTMTFGKETDEADAIRMVDMALDGGINWVDTADAYTGFRSEEIVGKALKGKRRDVVLATKVRNFVGPNPIRDGGLNRWHIIDGVENSLRRLQTDYIDVYYLHQPDYSCPIEESLAAMDYLVNSGKVIYVGVSNFAAWQMCEAVLKAEMHNWAKPVVTQNVYNMITRGIDDELLPFLKKFGIGLTTYNPLAGGMLTGKHKREAKPAANTRFAEVATYKDRYWTDANFDAVEKLSAIADEAGMSVVELSFRWLVSQPQVDSILVGSRSLGHFQSNLDAINKGAVSEDICAACDEVWQSIRGSYFRYNR